MKTRVDQATLERAQELRAEGKLLREIIEELGIPMTTLHRHLSDNMVEGIPSYGEIFDHRNEYLCLLSPETRTSLDQHYNNKRK